MGNSSTPSPLHPLSHPSARIQRRGWVPLCSVNLHLNQQQKAFSWPQKCQELGQPAVQARQEGKEVERGGWWRKRHADVRSHQRGTVSATDQAAACGRVSASQPARQPGSCSVSFHDDDDVKVQRITYYNKFSAYLHSFVVVNNVRALS